MKAASISEIKTELKGLPPAQLTELCLRLARFKKENKELLTYLLFEANDGRSGWPGLEKCFRGPANSTFCQRQEQRQWRKFFPEKCVG